MVSNWIIILIKDCRVLSLPELQKVSLIIPIMSTSWSIFGLSLFQSQILCLGQRSHSTFATSLSAKNVVGGSLEPCCFSPLTGYYRDGYCKTGSGDFGVHTVCAQVTADFLEYTKSRGNDLSTPAPEYGFPGLKPGDKWCLCASRWAEAESFGHAPPLFLSSTHEKALKLVPLETLIKYAVDAESSQTAEKENHSRSI